MDSADGNKKLPESNKILTTVVATQSSTRNERTFNNQRYISDLKKYDSKLEAKAVVSAVKSSNIEVKARVIHRKDGIFVFFDEKTFYAIQSGEIKIQNQTGIKKHESHQQIQLKSINLKSRTEKPVKIPRDKKKILLNEKKLPNQSRNKSSLRIQPTFPAYLLSRFSKDAQNLMKMGILRIYKTHRKDLEKNIGILSAEQVKFDNKYEKEQEILIYLRELIKIYEKRLSEEKLSESEIFISKNIITKREKFTKYLNLIDNKGIDEVSYLIFKSLKGKSKKYPLSENHLIKKIKDVIEKKWE